MAASKKNIKDSKYGLSGASKKIGVNFWRCFFTGLEKNSATEQLFFIELEMLNPALSPSEPLLGFKPRVSITEEDLQYTLAGTIAARNLQSETIVQPSYVVVRVGMMGAESKQLCAYHSIKSMRFSSKPFTIQMENKLFSEDQLSGYINITEEDYQKHPEYLSDKGYASWNLKYEVIRDMEEGYKNSSERWFPFGIKTNFSGMISFDGADYIVEPRKCMGYMDRYWGKTFPYDWFHISSASLTSIISGRVLQNSFFAIQGLFENKVAFIGGFEGSDIIFPATLSKRQYTCVCDCIQAPEGEEPEDNKLHWSVSINNKLWVLDIDVYCKVKELSNRVFELPEGNRKVLSVLQGSTGTGEIKLFKKNRNTLEQIEYAEITKAVCEFGHEEDGEL
ncbi:MAG: hypothetical protein K5907_07115 [Treponema sp.]|nr:hypothetical protein [Treponema sp.]